MNIMKSVVVIAVWLVVLFARREALAAVTVTYLHPDALGSPVAATDEAGAVKWREAYRPYGARTRDEAASSTQSVFYAAHSEDEPFGLVDMGARSYDPVLGRFLATDPAAVTDDPRTFNRYAYAANNPFVFVDPDGRIFETALDIVSLGLSMRAFAAAPTIANGLGLAWDATALVVPGLPGGAGILRHGVRAADAVSTGKTVVKAALPAKAAPDPNILSGHGGLVLGRTSEGALYSPVTVVPEGTSVMFFSKHGDPIKNRTGNAVELGRLIPSTQFPEAAGGRLYRSGSIIPDYTLTPPDGLRLLGNPTVVSQPTRLSKLLRPGAGCVRWAACTVAP